MLHIKPSLRKTLRWASKNRWNFFKPYKPEKDQVEDIVKGIISIGLIVIGVWMWNHF